MSFLLSVTKLSTTDIAKISGFVEKSRNSQALYHLLGNNLLQLLLLHRDAKSTTGRKTLAVHFTPTRLQETKEALTTMKDEIGTILVVLDKLNND